MNNHEGTVSVIVPVYNGCAFLAKTIESVLAQSYPAIELIAVDDGSTDESARLLAGYGPKITVISQVNQGVAAARNAGIRASSGEFVAFVDQDDCWLREKVTRQVELLRSNERIGLVHTGVIYFDEATQAEVGPENPNVRPDLMTGDCYESLLMMNAINNSSVMVRRAALDRVGGPDENIRGNTVQDYDLWLRIAKDYHLAFVPERLTVFRLHAGQGHRDLRAMLSEQLALLLRHQSDNEWRRSSARRRRLADLHDRLAVTHFEAGDARAARRHFAQALQIEPSRRRLGRFSASCLPNGAVARLRRAWHQWKTTPECSEDGPQGSMEGCTFRAAETDPNPLREDGPTHCQSLSAHHSSLV